MPAGSALVSSEPTTVSYKGSPYSIIIERPFGRTSRKHGSRSAGSSCVDVAAGVCVVAGVGDASGVGVGVSRPTSRRGSDVKKPDEAAATATSMRASAALPGHVAKRKRLRSEEHTSELQSRQ